MEKRARLIFIVSIIIISTSLLLAGFAFAQDNGEEEQVSEIELSEQAVEENTELIVEEKISPKEAFINYIKEKLSDEEKEQFEEYQNMEPAEAFLKAIEKYQLSKEEE